MSSENQEVAATEQAPTLSGDTNTPTQNTDWKASLSDEIRNEKSLENISDIESNYDINTLITFLKSSIYLEPIAKEHNLSIEYLVVQMNFEDFQLFLW